MNVDGLLFFFWGEKSLELIGLRACGSEGFPGLRGFYRVYRV